MHWALCRHSSPMSCSTRQGLSTGSLSVPLQSPSSCEPKGFGWVLNTSSAFRLRLSTTACMPQPPPLQRFLSLAQNTTHQSVGFCWTHESRAETRQEKHLPSPVPVSHPGWGSWLAQAAEIFSLIPFLSSLSLYRPDFPGSKFPHNTRKPSRPLQSSTHCMSLAAVAASCAKDGVGLLLPS